jgi:alkylhydroperoxidase family enzyme
VALEFAEEMMITGWHVPGELFAWVRAAFGEAEIVELTAAIVFETFRGKFNVALGSEAQVL